LIDFVLDNLEKINTLWIFCFFNVVEICCSERRKKKSIKHWILFFLMKIIVSSSDEERTWWVWTTLGDSWFIWRVFTFFEHLRSRLTQRLNDWFEEFFE
jgi:hypothetical protein